MKFIIFALVWFAAVNSAFSENSAVCDGLKSAGVSINEEVAAFEGNDLQVDTTKAQRSWTRAVSTHRGILKPGKFYTLFVELKQPEVDGQKALFNIIVRDCVSMDPKTDLLHRGIIATKNYVGYKFQFSIPEGLENHSLQIHLPRNFRGTIGSFKLVEGYGEDFIAAEKKAPAYEGPLPNAPSGAEEFDVLLPESGGLVVDAADFGLSENSENVAEILNAAIEHCKKVGARKLSVPKGTYYVKDLASINFFGLKNFEFDGNGSTFVFFKQKPFVNFDVKNCERVKLCNFNFDWDWERDPLGSLLKVVGTGREDGGKEYVDFEFYQYKEFPRKDVRIAVVSSYDPKTKSVGVEGGFDRQFEFFKGKNKPETKWLTPNTLRVFSQNLFAFKEGMLFRAHHYYYDMVGIRMRSNEHLTLQNINIFSCVGHGLAVSGTQKYWQFVNVNIRPPKGKKRRVITCTADHCHISSSCGFFKMVDCEFTRGGDDCLNIHDGAGFALKTGARTLKALNMAYIHDYAKGDEIELRHGDYSPTGVTAKIVGVKLLDKAKREYKFVFDRDLPEPAQEGFIMFNRRFDSRNIILRGCYFHHCKARGMLLLGRDILVENCRFVATGKGAMNIESGYTFNLWSEGYGAYNIIVRGCLFDAVNPRGMQHDGKPHDIYIGVYMMTDPSYMRTDYPLFHDILIENNTFKNTYGLAAFISSAKNVVVKNNPFENTLPREKPLYYRSAFWVAHASDIFIVNNVFKPNGLAPNAGVFFDSESVKNLTFKGNSIE